MCVCVHVCAHVCATLWGFINSSLPYFPLIGLCRLYTVLNLFALLENTHIHTHRHTHSHSHNYLHTQNNWPTLTNSIIKMLCFERHIETHQLSKYILMGTWAYERMHSHSQLYTHAHKHTRALLLSCPGSYATAKRLLWKQDTDAGIFLHLSLYLFLSLSLILFPSIHLCLPLWLSLL